MNGRARAPGAGTVLNALATGVGSAFAIDLTLDATVKLTTDDEISGRIGEDPDADTSLIERCLELTIDRYGSGEVAGGVVETHSDIPLASGLKSSSAAANATVLATLEALDHVDSVDPVEAAHIGVTAARDVGVTVTGAFDDASASMLGGVTITDNSTDVLLAHEPFDHAVAVYTPDAQAFSADADVDRCKRIAGVADTVAELAQSGAYTSAMTINGFAYSAALEYSPRPTIEALSFVEGVSLSGTGPSTLAIGNEPDIEKVATTWEELPGSVRVTTTDNRGARIV